MAVKWAEEFRKIHPKVRIDISAGGAGKGITDALAKVVDLGMVSRDIYPQELESALLADPRIFVLDEATSSVDTVTEQLIQNAIEKVMTGRTSFIIAHRLSTIRRADVILVVHDGKIIESGTHRSLMSARGPYYRLYTRQYREEQTKSMMD